MKRGFYTKGKGFLCSLALVGLMLTLTTNVHAQQELLTTQWAYNKLTINPAYAGGKDIFSSRVLHRQQWIGIDGRPVTTLINAHSPLHTDKMGLGLTYAHDKLGVMSTNILSLSYSYRILFDNNSTLGLGLSFGMESLKIATSNLSPVQANDPILESNLSILNAKAGFGIYYYGDKYYVGFSSPNLIPNKMYKDSQVNDANFDGNGSQENIHLYAMAGYGIEMAEGDFILKPQVLVKSVVGKDRKAPFQLDANISLIMYQRFIVGGTLRTTIANKNMGEDLENIASADILGGVYITPNLLVGYSYDFTMGKLNDYDSGSHEIMLGFDIDLRRKGAYTPRLF